MGFELTGCLLGEDCGVLQMYEWINGCHMMYTVNW